MRAETKRAAADRALRERQQQQANVAGVTAANQAALLAGPSPDTGQPYTQEEWELRERLRLEAVERRSRSLRSSPVAQTYRKLDGGGGASAGKRVEDNPAETIKAESGEALKQALDTIGTVTSGLEDQIAGGGPGGSSVYRGTPRNADHAGSGPGCSRRRDCGHAARLLCSGAARSAARPPRMGAYLRRLVFGSSAGNAAFRRLPRPGAGRGCHSLLLGGSAAHPGPARDAGYRHGSGRDEPGSIAARCWFSPLDLPGRALDFAPI